MKKGIKADIIFDNIKSFDELCLYANKEKPKKIKIIRKTKKQSENNFEINEDYKCATKFSRIVLNTFKIKDVQYYIVISNFFTFKDINRLCYCFSLEKVNYEYKNQGHYNNTVSYIYKDTNGMAIIYYKKIDGLMYFVENEDKIKQYFLDLIKNGVK